MKNKSQYFFAQEGSVYQLCTISAADVLLQPLTLSVLSVLGPMRSLPVPS
jgi:hypothetical protein